MRKTLLESRLMHIGAWVVLALLSGCQVKPDPEFWNKRNELMTDQSQLLLKYEDFTQVFNEAYVIDTDTLLQNYTPYYHIDPISFGDEGGFSLLKRCIPPSGAHTCFTGSYGFCFCEKVGFEKKDKPVPNVKFPPCKLTFDKNTGRIQCAGECKTGTCTLIITRNNSHITSIGCICLVQLPAKYQVKNIPVVEFRPNAFPTP